MRLPPLTLPASVLHECCTILQDLRVRDISQDRTHVDVEKTYKFEPIGHGSANVIVKIA